LFKLRRRRIWKRLGTNAEKEWVNENNSGTARPQRKNATKEQLKWKTDLQKGCKFYIGNCRLDKDGGHQHSLGVEVHFQR